MYDWMENTLYHLLASLEPLHHLHASGMNCHYIYCTFKETDIYSMSRGEHVDMNASLMMIGGYF